MTNANSSRYAEEVPPVLVDNSSAVDPAATDNNSAAAAVDNIEVAPVAAYIAAAEWPVVAAGNIADIVAHMPAVAAYNSDRLAAADNIAAPMPVVAEMIEQAADSFVLAAVHTEVEPHILAEHNLAVPAVVFVAVQAALLVALAWHWQLMLLVRARQEFAVNHK